MLDTYWERAKNNDPGTFTFESDNYEEDVKNIDDILESFNNMEEVYDEYPKDFPEELSLDESEKT